jgi:hypothetical protein
MKNNLIKTTFLGILLFLSINTFCQSDSVRLNTLEAKVHLIEDYKSNIDQYAKVELEKHKSELKAEIDKDYENVRNLFALILLIGVPTTLYGLYEMFWGTKKKIKKAIEEKIEKIVELKREDIIKLINNQAYDRQIKANKKILILSVTEEAQEDVKNTTSNMGFKNLIFRLTNSTTALPENDLIIINNIDGEFSQEKINEIVDENSDEDTFFVAYTSKQIDRNPRMNFANSKFTLYHSILTTLAFTTSIQNISELIDE